MVHRRPALRLSGSLGGALVYQELSIGDRFAIRRDTRDSIEAGTAGSVDCTLSSGDRSVCEALRYSGASSAQQPGVESLFVVSVSVGPHPRVTAEVATGTGT